MKLDAAIFDLDGTLINSLTFWDLFWEQMGQKYLHRQGFRPTEQEDKAVRTMLLKDAMAMIHQLYNAADSAQELLAYCQERIVEFYTCVVKPKSGVVAFLEHLKANGVKMCVASATERKLVLLAMEHCGLSPYFSQVFSCDDIGKGKDQPDIYLYAAKQLGETVENTWVFEDSVVAIETATKLGMPTVAIYDPNNYGQERMQEIAKHYIAKGETLEKLI